MSRFNERLRPLKDINYRIPGDDKHLSPRLRSRSRSRSSSRPRVDTPATVRTQAHFDIVDEGDENGGGVDLSESLSVDDSEPVNGDDEHEEFGIRRSSSRQNSQLRTRRPNRAPASIGEGEESEAGLSTADEGVSSRPEGTPAKVKTRRTRRGRQSPSPSPLRDVIDSVADVASRVASTVTSAISSVSEHETGASEAIEGEASPWRVHVLPPSGPTTPSQRQQQQLSDANSLQTPLQPSSPAWVLPLILGLILTLGLLGQQFLPSLISLPSSSSYLPTDTNAGALHLHDRDAVIEAVLSHLSKDLVKQSQYQHDRQALTDSIKTSSVDIHNDIDAAVRNLRQQLTEYQQHERAIDAANIEQLSADFQRQITKVTHKNEDEMFKQIESFMTRILSQERAITDESLKTLQQSLQESMTQSLNDIREHNTREINERLHSLMETISQQQFESATSSSEQQPQQSSIDQSAIDKLMANLSHTLTRQFQAQFDSLQSSLEQRLQSLETVVVDHSEIGELEQSLKSLIASTVDRQESSVKELESRIVTIIDDRISAVRNDLGSSLPSAQSLTIDDSTKQHIIDDALSAVRSEIDARLESVKSSIPVINTDELTETIAASVKSELTPALESLIKRSVNQALSEKVLTEQSKSIADLVSHYTTLANKIAVTDDELQSLRASMEERISALLSTIGQQSQSESPNETVPHGELHAALQRMSVMDGTMKAFDAAIQALQSDISTVKSSQSSQSHIPEAAQSTLDLETVRRLVYEVLSAHASSLYGALAPSVQSEINGALEQFAADRTNLVDYAVSSAGGRIVAAAPTVAISIAEGSPLLNFLLRAYVPVRGPGEILTDSMSVGTCWPMQGSNGSALIALRQPVSVSAFTLQHVPVSISPDPSSMPRTLSLYGVSDSDVARVTTAIKTSSVQMLTQSLSLLGQFTYDRLGRQVQQWPASDSGRGRAFQHVLVQFESNYGNPNYTCVYRVRVHGTPAH